MVFNTFIVVTPLSGFVCNWTSRRRKHSISSNCRFKNCNWWPGCGKLQYRSQIASNNRINWSAHCGIFNSSRFSGSSDCQADFAVKILSNLSAVTKKREEISMRIDQQIFQSYTYIALLSPTIWLGTLLALKRWLHCNSCSGSPTIRGFLAQMLAFHQSNAKIWHHRQPCHQYRGIISQPSTAQVLEWTPAIWFSVKSFYI